MCRKVSVLVSCQRYTCSRITGSFISKMTVDSVFLKNFAKVFRWVFFTEHLRAIFFVFHYSYQYGVYHFSTRLIRILSAILLVLLINIQKKEDILISKNLQGIHAKIGSCFISFFKIQKKCVRIRENFYEQFHFKACVIHFPRSDF